VFSRNSASSRAIPIERRIQEVIDDPAMPLEWGSNRPGMQAGEELDGESIIACRDAWLDARNEAVEQVYKLNKLGLHKQVANRLLEPFLWHTAVISSTDWDGWTAQRLSPLAQPEIRALAKHIDEALEPSRVGFTVLLERNDWHLPYIAGTHAKLQPIAEQRKISVARCARVSYKPFDGEYEDIERDLALYDRLVSASPRHASPLEHIATPATPEERPQGNFRGWHQLRHMIDLEELL
jgi:hypothetical protein